MRAHKVRFEGLPLVLLGSGFLSVLVAAEPNAELYPRRASEIKATLEILAPERSSPLNVPNAYIQRLKQFRYICGVPYEDLQWDAQQADLAQHAALICSKLGHLTHSPGHPPGMSDSEYDLCKKGAGQSNLFMGITQPVACVDGWMNDSDPSNIGRVGHRRWCLNPAMQKSGFGTEGKFAAMYAFDTSRKQVPDWDFVAYPARGYMPVEFFGERHAWSVSLNMAKFVTPGRSKPEVALKAANDKLAPEGEPLKLDFFVVESGGFGSGPAIIFRPKTLTLKHDARYIVEITGLKAKKGDDAPLRYLVHFVSLPEVAVGPEARGLYTTYLQQRLTAAQALPNRVDQLDAVTGLTEDKFLPLCDPALATAVRACLAELLKDPALRREQEAAQRYKLIVAFEEKYRRDKNKLAEAAAGYRDLAQAYKETRAGQRAADDFKRLLEAVR